MEFTVEQVSIRENQVGPFTRISAYYRITGVPNPAQVAMYKLGTTLIDCGAPQVLQPLLDHGVLDGVEQVLLTHHHEDHVALAAEACARGIPVFAPRDCVPYIQQAPQIPLYRAAYWGQPASAPGVQALDYGDQIATSGGTLQVLHTPGHTPAHAAYVLLSDGSHWVISGDVYLGEQPLNVFYETSIPDWIASCDSILALEGIIQILPAHGSVPRNGRKTIEAFRNYLMTQTEAIRTTGTRLQSNNSCEIARELYDYDPEAFDYSGGEINPACFVRGLLDPVRSLPATIPCPQS